MRTAKRSVKMSTSIRRTVLSLGHRNLDSIVLARLSEFDLENTH